MNGDDTNLHFYDLILNYIAEYCNILYLYQGNAVVTIAISALSAL